MARHRTLVLLVLLLATLGSAASTAESLDPALASLEPTITVAGSARQAARVEQAVAVFLELDMPLPDLQAVFAADPADCSGFLGLFQETDPVWRVTVCSDLPFVVPHELAHAWERSNLAADDRAAYMEARGLESWRHPKRVEAGVEDVAMMVQHIILGDGHSHRDDVHEAFDLLLDLSRS